MDLFQSQYILAEDGSGRGAAFVAAVAVRLQKEKEKYISSK